MPTGFGFLVSARCGNYELLVEHCRSFGDLDKCVKKGEHVRFGTDAMLDLGKELFTSSTQSPDPCCSVSVYIMLSVVNKLGPLSLRGVRRESLFPSCRIPSNLPDSQGGHDMIISCVNWSFRLAWGLGSSRRESAHGYQVGTHSKVRQRSHGRGIPFEQSSKPF